MSVVRFTTVTLTFITAIGLLYYEWRRRFDNIC